MSANHLPFVLIVGAGDDRADDDMFSAADARSTLACKQASVQSVVSSPTDVAL